MAIQCGQCRASQANLEWTTRTLESGVKLQIVRCMLCGWDKSRILTENAMTRTHTIGPQISRPQIDPNRDPVLIVCLSCKEEKKHNARGLCLKCYGRENLAGTIDQNYPRAFMPKGSVNAICERCFEYKRQAARGLCHRCNRAEIIAGTRDQNYPSRQGHRPPHNKPDVTPERITP